MPDRFRADVKGDDVLLVIKGNVGPELAVTVPADDICVLIDALARAEGEWINAVLEAAHG